MKNDWIPVDGYKNLPVGVWLVTCEGEFFGSKLRIAYVHPNVTAINSNFGFDEDKVIAYMELPKEYKVPKIKKTIKLHTCPYKVEIYNDHETLCDCDDVKRSLCAEEV